MKKKKLFDATLLRKDCPNRGIPIVITDIIKVIIELTEKEQ